MARYALITLVIFAILCIPVFALHMGDTGVARNALYLSVLTLAGMFAFPNVLYVFASIFIRVGLVSLAKRLLRPAGFILKFADRLSFHSTVVSRALLDCVNLQILAQTQLGAHNHALAAGLAELAYLEDAQGKSWAPLASLISDIGALHLEAGKIVKSKELLHRALILAETAYAQDGAEQSRSHLINALRNMASVHMKLGDFPMAVAEYKRCLDLRERSVGAKHWLVGFMLCSLADAHMQNGDFKSALPLLQRAFMISQDASVPKELQVYVEDSLGEAFRGLGNLDEARRHLVRASSLASQRLANKHPLCGIVLEDLGKLYRDLGDYEAAESYFKQNLDLAKQRGRAESVELSRCLKNYAECLRKMNRNKEADDLEHRAEQIRYKVRSA